MCQEFNKEESRKRSEKIQKKKKRQNDKVRLAIDIDRSNSE